MSISLGWERDIPSRLTSFMGCVDEDSPVRLDDCTPNALARSCSDLIGRKPELIFLSFKSSVL
jgi:hypothetical protein